jgi:glycosyltransferase involved in cell wall biosynthesis
MPHFSIITPLFNKGPYIADTIASVRSQTMRDWEMIVVDNGSTDEGPTIAGKLVVEDPRIRLVDFTLRRGPGAARNAGLQLARGDWVLFLDADDLIEPQFLDRRWEVARGRPDAQIIAGKWQEFEDSAPELRDERVPCGWGRDGAAVEEIAIAFAPWALHAAVVACKWLEGDRAWVEELDRVAAEDAAFWFRVVRGATVAWCDDAGALYRKRTPGSRAEIQDAARWIAAVRTVIQSNLRHLESRRARPTPAQFDNLFRAVEDLYRSAARSRLHAEAASLADQSRKFMDGAPLSAGTILRKALGIPLFNRLWHGNR